MNLFREAGSFHNSAKTRKLTPEIVLRTPTVIPSVQRILSVLGKKSENPFLRQDLILSQNVGSQGEDGTIIPLGHPTQGNGA